jgi:hypothetical protein
LLALVEFLLLATALFTVSLRNLLTRWEAGESLGAVR